MELLFRADFDFRNEKYGIKHCVGYVVCSDVDIQGESCTFKVKEVVVKKLIGKKVDFLMLEKLAIQNCKLIYNYTDEEVIEMGNFEDFPN